MPPPYITLPLRSVEFTHLWWSYDNAVCTHVIYKQDGFPEPIREEMPWLVRNEQGAHKL